MGPAVTRAKEARIELAALHAIIDTSRRCMGGDDPREIPGDGASAIYTKPKEQDGEGTGGNRPVTGRDRHSV